jgi:hypothetical protein
MSAPSETMSSALGSLCDSRSDADPTAAAKPVFGGGQNACTQVADRLLRPPDLSTDACRSSRGPSDLSRSHCTTYRPLMAARTVHWAVVWSHRLKVVSSPRKVERDVRIACQCTGPTAIDGLGRCPDRFRDGFDEIRGRGGDPASWARWIFWRGRHPPCTGQDNWSFRMWLATARVTPGMAQQWITPGVGHSRPGHGPVNRSMGRRVDGEVLSRADPVLARRRCLRITRSGGRRGTTPREAPVT